MKTKHLMIVMTTLSVLVQFSARADYEQCDGSTYPNHIFHCHVNCNTGISCSDTGRLCEWAWHPINSEKNSEESRGMPQPQDAEILTCH